MNPTVDNPQTYNWSHWAEKQPIPGLWGQLPDDPAERQAAILQALQADIAIEPSIESPGPSSELWCTSMLKAIEKEQDHQKEILHNHLTESPKSSMQIFHPPMPKKKRGRPKGVCNSIIKMPMSQVRSSLQLRSQTRCGQHASFDNAMHNDSIVPMVDSGANLDNMSKEKDVLASNLSTLSLQHCGSESALKHHDSVKEKAAVMIITPACESMQQEELISEQKADDVQLIDTFDVSDDQLEYIDLEEFNQPNISDNQLEYVDLEKVNQPLPSILSASCSTATSDGSQNTAQSSFLLTSSVCPEESLPTSLDPSSSNGNTCHNAFIDPDSNQLAPTESKISKGTLIFSQVRSTSQAGFDYDSVTFRVKSKVKKKRTSKHLARTKQQSKNLPSRDKKKEKGKEMEMDIDLNQKNSSEPSEVQSKSQALQTMIANLTKVAHSCRTAKKQTVLQWNSKFLMFFSLLAQDWRKSDTLKQEIKFKIQSIMSSKDMQKQAHISMHHLIHYVAWMKNTPVQLDEAQEKEKNDALHGFKLLFRLLEMK